MHTEALRPAHRGVRRHTAAALLQATAGQATVQALHTAEVEAEAEARQAALMEVAEAAEVREDRKKRRHEKDSNYHIGIGRRSTQRPCTDCI